MSDRDDADRPATFREVLASGEYRALYLASSLSWFGDYVARAAVTALVYQRTESVAASAATFAISYVPWLGLGPILAALAERLPYRRTMIVADLLRMVLIALVAVPGMPVWGMIALLFATSLCNPPFEAARSALLARVLDGDRYVVGLTLQTTTHQLAQIAGYLSGAGLSAVDPQGALLFNAATFGISACLIGLRVHPRPPALAVEDRTDLLRETGDGLRLVFGAPVLRSVAIIVFLASLFAVVPEGLAAAWAADLADSPQARGWIQGVIMISNPLGFVVGGLIVARLLGPKRRQRLIPIVAVLVPASLVPAVFNPAITGVAALSFACGVAAAGLLPAANGLFVQALPNAYRARAFGVMKSGIQVLQGVAVFVTGSLADQFGLARVVGVWGMCGVGVMALAVLTWPDSGRIAAEVDRVRDLNKASESREPLAGRHAAPDEDAHQHANDRVWRHQVDGAPGRHSVDALVGRHANDRHPGEPHSGEPHSGEPHSGEPHSGEPHSGEPHSGDGQPGEHNQPDRYPTEQRPGEQRPGEQHPTGQRPVGQQQPGDVTSQSRQWTASV